MTLEDGMYLAERVRRLCSDRPHGLHPWKGTEILALLDGARRFSEDHQRFYLAFLSGIRDLLEDEDEETTLERFARQASLSEPRVLADGVTTRDHLTHVTQVFLVGWLILNECERFRTLGDDWVPYGWSRESRFVLLNRAWLHTALLHDCAYSVQEAQAAHSHEVRVRAMFGAAYKPATSGGVDAKAAKSAGACLWKRRAEIIGRRISAAVRAKLDDIEAHPEHGPDHGFVTGQALMREAQSYTVKETKELFEVAAVSLACHNFRWIFEPTTAPEESVAGWFSVDFWSEPLAALLTVADEIQEWGRERPDALFAPGDRTGFRPADTVLTHLETDDANGLTIKAGLVFRLYPEDRLNRLRQASEREIKNAQANRQYRRAFGPRSAEHKMLDLHLRIDELVEDIPCGVPRRYDWPISVRRSLRDRSSDALGAAPQPRGLTELSVRIEGGAHKGSDFKLSSDGTAALRPFPGRGGEPLRALIIAPGGAGKSTLLRALARHQPSRGRKVLPLYVEELPDELSDLFEECSSIRKESPEAEVLLVVDHLDRLVGTPKEQYWTTQLLDLPREPWLHVVGACRTEEFESVLDHALGKEFQHAKLAKKVGPLMEDADRAGRATARGIERHLRGDKAVLDELGRLALAMKGRRFIERPELAPAPAATFDGANIVTWTEGKVRFIHDALQDYLGARWLARELAQEAERTTPQSRLRAVLELPRDVFRLLLDVIASSKQLDLSERRRAARGLSKGLQHESTLRHWFADLNRLASADEVIPALHDAFSAEPEIAPITSMLVGILLYGDIIMTQLANPATRDSTVERIRRAVEPLANALALLERTWPSENPPVQAEVLTVYIGDHLLTLLSRVAIYDRAVSLELAQTALNRLDLNRSPKPGELSPASLRKHLKSFADGPPPHALKALYEDVFTRARTAPAEFALRCYQLAGHVGGTYLLVPSITDEGIQDAVRFHHRAIAHARRVLRGMQRPGDNVEQFGSEAHGKADAARHYSALVHFWARAVHATFPLSEEAPYRLLDAAQAQQSAWAEARTALRPGERLPESQWLALGDLAFGRALATLAAKGTTSTEDIKRTLAREESSARREYRRWAETSRRDARDGIYDFLQEKIGPPVDFCRKVVEMVQEKGKRHG